MKSRCSRTGVPFEYSALVRSSGAADVHPQILLPLATATKELERLAGLDETKPLTKGALQQAEYRLRLCGYIYASHHELLDTEFPLEVGGFVKRSEPLDEYASVKDIRAIAADASALLGFAALVHNPPKSRRLTTGMWVTSLYSALADIEGTTSNLDANLAFAVDGAMTQFLTQRLGQSSFVTPLELHTYLGEVLVYTELADCISDVFNTLYTAYQLVSLPRTCEAASELLPKVVEAQRFIKAHPVDSISDALARGKRIEGGAPNWKIGKAIFKSLQHLREYESEIPDTPVQSPARVIKFQIGIKGNT